MQWSWEAMLTFSEGAKLKDAGQNLRMRGYPWESCSSLLCGLTVDFGRFGRSLGLRQPPATFGGQGQGRPPTYLPLPPSYDLVRRGLVLNVPNDN